MQFEQLLLFESPDSFAPSIDNSGYKLPEQKKKHYTQLELDFNPPQSDKEWFLRYQEQYRNGDQKALTRIYNLVKDYSLKMISKEASRKGFYLCEDDRIMKAHNIASYITEQLFKRPDLYIKEIGGYIHNRMMHELYYKTKVDDLFKNVQKISVKKYFEEELTIEI